MNPTGGDMTAAFTSALESASAEPAAETSPVSTPTTESTPAEPTAPAATTPAAEAQASESVSAEEKPKGEPPAWRWQDILENTRKSVKEETEAAIRKQYEAVQPFVGMSAEERAGLMVWNAALRGDPQALAQVAQVNPQLASALSGQRAPEQPEPEPQPDAAIQLADGSTVPVYTPEGMKKREAWLQKQLESSLTQKFQPVLSTAEKLRQAEQREEQQAQTQRWAAQVLSPVQRLPHFDEFKPTILKAITDLPKDFTGQLEDVVYAAYASALTAKLEGTAKTAEANALASITQRAVSSTGNPNAANATTPQKFQAGTQGFADALAHFATADAR